MINRITDSEDPFDVVVIGGGATGLGIAVDAASRGYSTVLLERDDFAKGTSSRSTKLAHGGVRYLAQGNIRLVMEALRERGLMRQNASVLIRDLPFIVPAYRWWEIPFYYIGLRLYDALSGKYSLGRSSFLSSSSVIKHLPGVRKKGLKGGIMYYDGQFDDSRMAISLAKTAEKNGAVVLNYAEVIQIKKDHNEDLFHLHFKDKITDQNVAVSARTVFNATGVYVDDILKLEHEQLSPMIAPSRGAHVVVPSHFLQSSTGLMIPKTPDGRVLFAIPWYNKTLIGTTDTPVKDAQWEPRPSEAEIQFILDTAAAYMTPSPEEKDIQSVFAGLRPLAAPAGEEQESKEISRGHKVLVSPDGMITIIGGKWTTYRRMAEDAVDQAIKSGQLPSRECKTDTLSLWISELDRKYGLAVQMKTELTKSTEGMKLAPELPRTGEDVRYMIHEEFAMKIEDVLSRRVRLLILDAESAIRIAPKIAEILEKELGVENYNKQEDLDAFKLLAKNYMWSKA